LPGKGEVRESHLCEYFNLFYTFTYAKENYIMMCDRVLNKY